MFRTNSFFRVAACIVFIHSAAAQQFVGALVRVSSPGAAATGPAVTGGRWKGSGLTLKTYICTAFGVSDFQVAGPEWLDTERFDIDAVFPPPADDETAEMVLQRLLAERFSLRTHRDSRLASVYDLRVDPEGVKFQAAVDSGVEAIDVAPGRLILTHVSMTRLAEVLSRETGRPVMNRTQLRGAYDVKLRWTPETLPEDLQKQLGLKIQPNRAQIGLLVVEAVERP